jgi:Ca2+-binding RTX toxin-like protein
MKSRPTFHAPRAVALAAVAGAAVAAGVGLGADPAAAAYTAQVQAGTLKINGNSASDRLVLRLAPGDPNTLQLDVGADGTADFSFDRGTFTAIEVAAGGGDDEVRVDQSNGAFFDEALTMNGGGGADTLIGGSGAETLIGGDGNDVVAGGDGNDVARLGGGADRFTWNPGDDNDTVEGEAGSDVTEFNGSAASESVDVSANGERVRFSRDIASIVTDIDGVERLAFHARGGADRIVVNDMTGTELAEADADLSAVGGGGDAQSDAVVARGSSGDDGVTVGSPEAGNVLVSGTSAQVLVTGAEAAGDTVNVETLGGADTITTGVGVSGPAEINVDGGDAVDTARYNGTAGDDDIGIAANGTEVRTSSPGTAAVDTTAVERESVLGLGGADTIGATGNLAPLTQLTLDGAAGADTLSGGNGADVLLGGSGNDLVDGNQGEDAAQLAAGADIFNWDPGDSNDTVEGGTGNDVLDFNGSGIGESVEVSANGGRVRVSRNIANIVMDLDDVEGFAWNPLGGPDAIVVNDMTGTDLTQADVDLGAFGGGGDGQADTVTVDGGNGPDLVRVSRTASQVLARGLAAQTRVLGSEPANDTLQVQTLDGNDIVSVAANVSDLIRPLVDLGAGE